MKTIKPPHATGNIDSFTKVFLAGSIEMGEAEMWQERVTKIFEEKENSLEKSSYYKEVVLFNPRRDDWNSGLTQNFEDPYFFQQVTWELHNINKANYVLFYFDPNTKSPITLMELGYIAGKGKKAVVVCPEGYWRKGNIEVICNLHSIRMVETLEEAVDYILKY